MKFTIILLVAIFSSDLFAWEMGDCSDISLEDREADMAVVSEATRMYVQSNQSVPHTIEDLKHFLPRVPESIREMLVQFDSVDMSISGICRLSYEVTDEFTKQTYTDCNFPIYGSGGKCGQSKSETIWDKPVAD